jgi:hypothetical protein
LPFEYLARRQLHVLLFQLALNSGEAGAQLKGGNRLVIDDCDDAIDLDRLRAARLRVRRDKAKAGD